MRFKTATKQAGLKGEELRRFAGIFLTKQFVKLHQDDVEEAVVRHLDKHGPSMCRFASIPMGRLQDAKDVTLAAIRERGLAGIRFIWMDGRRIEARTPRKIRVTG